MKPTNSRPNPRKEIKSLSYVLNVPMRNGELTVMAADNAEGTMTHSMRLANELQKTGIGVLIINCGFSSRRFREHFNAHYSERHLNPRLVIHTSTRGNLAMEREIIREYVSQGQIGAVILVGWEWACDSGKRKQKLYTFMRDLMTTEDVAMIVYANSTRELTAGRIDYFGLGKLTHLAYAVGVVESAEGLEEAVPRVKPLLSNDKVMCDATRGVLQLVKNLNDLQVQKEDVEDDDEDEFAIAA